MRIQEQDKPFLDILLPATRPQSFSTPLLVIPSNYESIIDGLIQDQEPVTQIIY